MLRDRARKRRQEAIDVAELHRKRLAARHVRHWMTEIGNVAGVYDLPPEIGIPFVNRLDAETDRIRRAARTAGETLEAREAYAADAFARIVAGEGKGHANRADVVITVDLTAFRLGHTHDGEQCSIVGGRADPRRARPQDGRRRVPQGRAAMTGSPSTPLADFGGHRPAELRAALELGAPPDFDGVECRS